MSEEKKKSFEELKKEINKPLEVPEDKFNTFILYNIDNAKIILNLIEKQKKEIENLKEINKEHQKLNGELRDEIKRQGNTREIEEKYIEENFISKDKIREKIKEIERKSFENEDKIFEFYINNSKWTIELVSDEIINKEEENKYTLGVTIYIPQKVLIRRNQSNIKKTILHELTHVLLYEYRTQPTRKRI